MIPTPDDTLTIAEERVGPLLDGELVPLLIAHREEVTMNKHLMVLAPDKVRYQMAEDAGALVLLVARLGGRIVGYSCNFISQHLHYTALRLAQNDAIFVTKDARASVGLRLMNATRTACAARGAQMIAWHAKPDTALAKVLVKRRGAKLQDLVFTEELRHG